MAEKAATGSAGRGYGQFCPVALAAELLCERWTVLVVRELLCGGRRFSDLRRGLPTMSPSLLTQRLRTLEDAGVVERVEVGGRAEYDLTEAGRELRPLVEKLGAWGQRWVKGLKDDVLDPRLLVWDIHRRLDLDAMPPGRTVVLFDFDDAPREHGLYWLIREGDDVDVCLKNPGCEVDLRVASPVRTLVEIWLGRASLRGAIKSGELRLEGESALRAGFPKWLLLSETASAAR